MLSRCVQCGICGRYAWISSRSGVGQRLFCFQKGDHSMSLNLEYAESAVEKFIFEHSRDPRLGALASENDPERAWGEVYTLEQKRDIIQNALHLEIHRVPAGRTFLAPTLKVAWKN
jgi:hypothetical protein